MPAIDAWPVLGVQVTCNENGGRVTMWTRTDGNWVASTPLGPNPAHGGKLVLGCYVCPLPFYQRDNKTTMLTCGGDKKLKVWTTDGEILAELSGHSDTVESACFPGGDLMVTGMPFLDWRSLSVHMCDGHHVHTSCFCVRVSAQFPSPCQARGTERSRSGRRAKWFKATRTRTTSMR